MATVFGNAGESALIEVLKRIAAPVLALVVASPFFYLGILWGIQRGYGSLAWSGVLAVCVATIWLQRRVWREAIAYSGGVGSWMKGAQGELRAHTVLADLPDEFAVFHDYHPVGGTGVRAKWNVDHLVVGPTGVFVLETKNYSRTRVPRATPGSRQEANVRQARANAVNLKERLKLWSHGDLGNVFVVPVLVYVQHGAFVETTREKDVHVIPARWLLGEVTNRAEKHLDMDQAGRIVAALYSQLSSEQQSTFAAEMRSYGEISKRARYEKRDAAAAAPDATLERPSAPIAAEVPTICPRCGAELVERHVRRGARAGKRLLGCRSFPACRYVYNLE
jgi:hypothetical protein